MARMSQENARQAAIVVVGNEVLAGDVEDHNGTWLSRELAAIGVDVRLHQLAALVIAGFFGGVAGTLFVVVDNSVFPDMMFWTFSLEVLIMCLLGGMYTFFGPFAGAAAIVLLRVFASHYTPYWSLVLGVILTLVIIFLPDGVLGYAVRRFRTVEARRA